MSSNRGWLAGILGIPALLFATVANAGSLLALLQPSTILADFANNVSTGCGPNFVYCFTYSRGGASATDLLPTSSSGASYNTFAPNQIRITSGLGLLHEETRKNFLLNSATPATQTTGSLTSSATLSYILWVNGSGSATMSSGTATGCGTGVATNGTPVIFTVTGTGTCTVTVSGSLNAFQLEQATVATTGLFGTSFIPTAGVVLTRNEDVVLFAGAALKYLQGPQGYAIVKTSGFVGNNNFPRIIGDFAANQGNIIDPKNTTNQVNFFNGSGASATSTLGSGTTWAGTVKALATWGPGNLFRTSANGGTAVTNFSAPQNAAKPWSLGWSNGGTDINGYIQKVYLGTVGLTAAQAAAYSVLP